MHPECIQQFFVLFFFFISYYLFCTFLNDSEGTKGKTGHGVKNQCEGGHRGLLQPLKRRRGVQIKTFPNELE